VWKTTEGSTGRLIQLCIGYFIFYVITGVTVKYFLGPGGQNGIQFLTYSTIGGTLICLAVVLPARWYRLQSVRTVTIAGVTLPSELLYIIPSGICTAVIIPTTTLMYSLKISVMVAMVIMRGSVIVVSRVVDAIQIRQGILQKTVYWQENIAVVFAVCAVGVHVLFKREGGFDFLTNVAAVSIFGSYITAYAFRIYIMNYFKNTRAKGMKLDNKGFFAVEQIAAAVALTTAAVLFFNAPTLFGWDIEQIQLFRGALLEPRPNYPWALMAGGAFGIVAFFSVFIFMFKGRTATFAGLVNRLTSLMAGTTSTLIFWAAFSGKFPKPQDWVTLVFIMIAVAFLTSAERRRAAELAAAKEL